MYTLIFDIIEQIQGSGRQILFLIESIGVTFIDNVYNLMLKSMTAFNGDKIAEVAQDIAHNCYIIIGIFALFRIALVLINTIIDPDKFTEKNTNIGNMLSRIVIVVVLLIAVPFIFDESRKLQSHILENNYISKLLIGTEITGKEVHESEKGVKVYSEKFSNIGKYIKDLIVRSLIYPDGRITDVVVDEKSNTVTYQCKNKIDIDCNAAVAVWNNSADFIYLEAFMRSYTKGSNGETIFIYKYTPLVILIVGLFATYVLLSFTIDIAVRTVELAALQILSPLFIVTYIDPKSSSDGPFKRWVSTCAKTYVSLFIKIAIVCLMIFFITRINDLFDAATMETSFFSLTRLLMLIAILIFAKKAPKWIGDMLGVEVGLEGLSIKNKLGGMALFGGLVSKGIDSAKKFAGQKAKNFGANRVRNTAARIGGMKEAHKANKIAKKNGTYNKNNRQSLWKQGEAAAKNSRYANWGKDAQGLLKDIGSGYMAGRLNVNPEAKSLNAKLKEMAEESSLKYNQKIGNTETKRVLRAEMIANNKEAKKLYTEVAMDSKTGDRLKVTNANGESVYVNPRGDKEMNAAFGNPTTEFKAYEAYGANLAISRGFKVDASTRQVIDDNGKAIASLSEYGLSNMSYAARAAIRSLVANNVKDNVSRYVNAMNQYNQASHDYSQAVFQYNQAISNFNNDSRVRAVLEAKTEYEAIETEYKELLDKDQSSLTNLEKEKLNNFKALEEAYRKAQTAYDEEKIKEEYGIGKIDDYLKDAKQRFGAWSQEITSIKSQISSVSDPAFNDSGKMKKDSSGNLVFENPYTVEINGEKLSPVDDFVRINEIQNMLNIKASKAKSKYDDAMKEPDSNK